MLFVLGVSNSKYYVYGDGQVTVRNREPVAFAHIIRRIALIPALANCRENAMWLL